MRETVAPAKLLDRRKITTVPGGFSTGAQPWTALKQGFRSTMWDLRNIPETYPPARYRFTGTDRIMTQFDDCLDPIIRPCGTSIVSRGWYGRQTAAVRFRRAERS